MERCKSRIALIALALLAGSASADTVYWNAGPDTQWTNAANWIGHVPTSSDFVVILPGPGPMVQGLKFISGLYIQPGANMVLIGELNVAGGASIQGNMSIAGTTGRFVHRDDVNLEGTITMWDGAYISRSGNGNGIFTVRPSGSILIPSYDTRGVVLGTNLQVYGTLRHESTQTITLGQVYLTDANSSYVAIEAGGVMTFTRGGDVARTYVTNQSPPYIANDGVIQVSGAPNDVVDIAAEIAVFNNGVISVDQPDMYIHHAADINSAGTLTRGYWACSNFGRVFFYGNPAITTIGPQASVRLWNNGSSILPNENLARNEGHLELDQGSGMLLQPPSGTFTNAGTITLGLQANISALGRFVNSALGTLDFWVAGPQNSNHSRVAANDVQLHGTLNTRVTSWYAPAWPDRIDLVDASSTLSGTFDQVNLFYTAVPFAARYDGSSMSLIAGGCNADFNQDGSVDFFDYLDFVNAFSANTAAADFNKDAAIDFFDYLDFVDAFSIGC